MKISQKAKPWFGAGVIGAVLLALVLVGTLAPSARAQGPLPPGYIANDLVAPDMRGESWCVGPGQRLLVLSTGVSSAGPTAVVIDQSRFLVPVNSTPEERRASHPNGC